jgi:flagellar motor switch protein FliM
MKSAESTEEIDTAVLQNPAMEAGPDSDPEIALFDLNHLDRIPKSQLRALHLVHENFVRNLASSLSAYLRSYVALNLVSLEQISYAEFLDGLSFPTCIAYLGLNPYEGTAVLELNMILMFAFMELLMGSKGRSSVPAQRKITDIEKSIMQTLLRVVLQDLTEAWKSVAQVDFSVQSLASEPQLMHVMDPAEAVIVIAVDVRIGSVSGLMNLAIPSIFIKRLRHKFEQLQQVRRSHANEHDQAHLSGVMLGVDLNFEAFLEGGEIATRTLLDLKAGDVLMFDQSMEQKLKGTLNGQEKWSGGIVAKHDKLVFEVEEALEAKGF